MKKNAPEAGVEELPMLPLRAAVLFPGAEITPVIGRRASRLAITLARETGGRIFVVAQRRPEVEAPGDDDLFPVGTIASIGDAVGTGGKAVLVPLVGIARARLVGPALEGRLVRVEPIGDPDEREREAVYRQVSATIENAIRDGMFDSKLPLPRLLRLPPGQLLNLLVEGMGLEIGQRQTVLEADTLEERFARVFARIGGRIRGRKLEKTISDRIRRRFEAAQKEFFLQEQLREIRKELGQPEQVQEGQDDPGDYDRLLARGKQVPFSDEARRRFDRELRRFASIPTFSPEAGVIRGYLDWLLDLPWGKLAPEQATIARVEEVLERSHYGLEDVKDRILEFVAVRLLAGEKGRSSILCLVGPPGTGKTTLAVSIAEALGRPFVRMSLGGMRDEAEIRGHRRTYVGAMPGRVIQYMKKAGAMNPVFLLDEIDKLGSDHRGDPSAALLEVLDSEINKGFIDNYLEVEFDLSKVFFITTANALHTIPRPLMDRMDVVEISGYTEKEKLEIAKGFIVKRQLEQSGLAVRKIRFEPAALVRIIGAYTREAGVRNLEREVQRICRKLARRKLEGRLEGSLKITAAGLVEFLGQARYHVNPGELAPAFGLAKGLAWTESGGQVLDVEARLLPGRGRVILTGKLGQVMQESARTAFSWVRELAGRSDVSIDFSRSDVHLHVPEGALPKDGPSAGITIAVAIASAVLNLPVDNRYAMTGELSLLGKVLPIGGLKEKLLAARRSGFRRLILPQANEPDISRLSEEVRGGIEIFYVKNMGEVLLHVLPVPAKRPGQARAPLYPKKNGGTDENAYPGQ